MTDRPRHADPIIDQLLDDVAAGRLESQQGDDLAVEVCAECGEPLRDDTDTRRASVLCDDCRPRDWKPPA